jgi:hypothetical protein
MPDEPILPVNLTISPAAWAEIDYVRHLSDQRSDDKADVLMIGWGKTILNDGRSWSHVVVSFYGKSQRHQIDHGVQFVNGADVIFFTAPEHHHRFEGEIVDFDRDKGFFLTPT